MTSVQEQERRLRERRCIYCGAHHIFCDCSWWTKYRMDMLALAFTLALLTFMFWVNL